MMMGLIQRYIYNTMFFPLKLHRFFSPPAHRFGLLALILCFLMLIASFSYTQFNSSVSEVKKKMEQQEHWNLQIFQSIPRGLFGTNGYQSNLSPIADKIIKGKRYNKTEEKEKKEKEIDDDADADVIRLQLLDKFDHQKAKRKNRQFYEQQVDLLPPQTKGVILLTNYRSGSTFLGELFNQHPNAFYIFEPLFPITRKCDRFSDLKTQVLHQHLKCNFPRFTDIYQIKELPGRSDLSRRECLINDFCFRHLTKELCQRDQCANYIYGNMGCRECGPVHLPLAMNACRAKQLSVVKVIRYCDIMNLKPILSDPSMDVKVVHLIRDPRGVESSRSKLDPQWKIEQNARNLCSRVLNVGLRSQDENNSAKWLTNRYKRVRYEDLSLEPLSWAEEIYKFVGLQLTPEVKQWIKQNTHAQARSKVNPYATDRDSAVTMQAWRNHLSLEQVLTVQNECSEMMKFYGYKNVTTQKELLDLQKVLIVRSNDIPTDSH